MSRVVGVGLGSLDGWVPVHKRPRPKRKPDSERPCRACGATEPSRFTVWHATLCRSCLNTKRRAQRRKPPVVRPALTFPQCEGCEFIPDPGYLVGGLCPLCQRERAA